VTTIKNITKLIEASSLGAASARAARKSVTAAEGDALARRASHRGQNEGQFRGPSGARTYRPASGSTPGRKTRKENK
jgi:hypothetical protein